MKTQRADFDGIPIFLRYSNIDHELSAYPKEKEAISLARKIGWKRALEAVYDPDMVTYSAEGGRSKFLDLLPLSAEMTALEIGVGFGQHTAEIASRVKRLDTLELRLVNAIFTKIRCEQTDINNVTFSCGGDDCLLPFPDATYDAVILNLVLEWCASGNPNEQGLASQRRLLSEITRVLKPHGFVQISTKNRFAYRLLIGGRDEHTYNIRFGSALPRWLLRLILRVQGKASPPGHLHSYSGLIKLITAAGLTPTQSYWAVPEMRFPEQFIPIGTGDIRAARKNLARQGHSRGTEFLMRATPASLVHYFTPGLFFVAEKK